jgi:hypothetical protein
MTTSRALQLSRRTICRLIPGMMAAPAARGSRSRIPGHSAMRKKFNQGLHRKLVISLSIGVGSKRSYISRCYGIDHKMSGLRRPARRWLGWLVAIAYLLGSFAPSMAVPIPEDIAELLAQRVHELAHKHGKQHDHQHQHSHADAKAAVHSHEGTTSAVADADQDRPDDHRHGNCCGSILCFSAVPPSAVSLLQFVPLQSRCDLEPDSTGVGQALGRLYRPPIA